jgi:hypothetical protein
LLDDFEVHDDVARLIAVAVAMAEMSKLLKGFIFVE